MMRFSQFKNRWFSPTTMAMILAAILWSTSYIGIHTAISSYSPGALALFRYFIASIGMIPLYFIFRTKASLTKKNIILIIIGGFLGFAVCGFTLNYSQIFIDPGSASFMSSQTPIFTAILAIIFLKERLTKMMTMGFTISFIGLIITGMSGKEIPHFNFALLFLFINIISLSIFTIILKPLLKTMNAIEVIALTVWAGTFFLLIYSRELWHQLPIMPHSATIAVIYLAIFPTVIGYTAWAISLRMTSAIKTSSCFYLIPFLTTIIAFFMLRESPQPLALAGCIIALFGAILAQLNQSKEKTSSPDSDVFYSSLDELTNEAEEPAI